MKKIFILFAWLLYATVTAEAATFTGPVTANGIELACILPGGCSGVAVPLPAATSVNSGSVRIVIDGNADNDCTTGGGSTRVLCSSNGSAWAAIGDGGGAGGVSDGDKGDITVSASGATWAVDNDAITYAKMQNISATQRVLGRNTAGAGDTEEVTASALLDWIGSTRGSVLYRGALGWAVLTPGTSGYALVSNGAGADPSYQAVSGALADGDKGDITVSASGATWTIDSAAVSGAKIADGGITSTAKLADGIVTNAKMANMAQDTIKCRKTASTGAPEDCTASEAATIIGVETIADLTAKTTPVAADLIAVADSAASNAHKKSQVDQVLAVYDSQTATLTNKTLDVEGTGNSITTVRYWDLDLAGCVGGTASHAWNTGIATAPTPACATGTNRVTGYVTFPDSDGDVAVQITRQLPDGFTGSFDADIWWKTTGTGNARFQISTACYADDEADDASFNTSTVTAAAGTSGRWNKQTITGITTTGCAGGELMRIRFLRNRGEASDTLNAALDVEKIRFKLRDAQ